MPDDLSNNPQRVYLQNLTTCTALMALADETLAQVLGNDATSTMVDGREQSRRDLQELLASRIQRQQKL